MQSDSTCLDAVDQRGLSLMCCAIATGKEETLHNLLIVGANPNFLCHSGNSYWALFTFLGITALHFACQLGKLDFVKMLLDNGARVNVQDNMGWTPLHWLLKADSGNSRVSIS